MTSTLDFGQRRWLPSFRIIVLLGAALLIVAPFVAGFFAAGWFPLGSRAQLLVHGSTITIMTAQPANHVATNGGGSSPGTFSFLAKLIPTTSSNHLVASTTIPLLPPAIALFALYGVMAWRSRIKPGRCRQCDYDNTGSVNGYCPECGTVLGTDSAMQRK